MTMSKLASGGLMGERPRFSVYFFYNKISASKVAILIQVVLQTGKTRFLGRLGMIIFKKSFETQLIVSPIANDEIVALQYFTVSVAKRLQVPAVAILLYQLISFATNYDQFLIILSPQIEAVPRHDKNFEQAVQILHD